MNNTVIRNVADWGVLRSVMIDAQNIPQLPIVEGVGRSQGSKGPWMGGGFEVQETEGSSST